MSEAEICAATGVGRTTLRRVLADAGVRKRSLSEAQQNRAARSLPRFDSALAARLYKEGASILAVARTLGVKESTVRIALKRTHTPSRRCSFSPYTDDPYGPALVDEKQFVYDYTVELLSLRRLARRHAISPELARKRLVQLGIAIRSATPRFTG